MEVLDHTDRRWPRGSHVRMTVRYCRGSTLEFTNLFHQWLVASTFRPAGVNPMNKINVGVKVKKTSLFIPCETFFYIFLFVIVVCFFFSAYSSAPPCCVGRKRENQQSRCLTTNGRTKKRHSIFVVVYNRRKKNPAFSVFFFPRFLQELLSFSFSLLFESA